MQGFGVLIALREVEEGRLQAQLVSENSETILGLPPQHFFDLDSFVDCLYDEDQADILWANIEVAEEITGDELIDTGPQQFQLKLAVPTLVGDRTSAKSTGSQSRACYAALHRAPDPVGHSSETGSKDGDPPILILELELVDDMINPLERPRSEAAPESMLSQPLPRIRSENSSRPSFSTNISEETDQSSFPHSSSAGPAETERSEQTEQKLLSPSVATDATTGVTSFPEELSSVLPAEHWDDDEQPYVPTEEQKQQSTVSGAKPLRGLAHPNPTRRTKSGNRGRRAPEIDIITILSQANEQLAAAEDLTSCLRAAVGIMAEVTGYSRVMAYKFDAAFNGHVVTELVSWNDTHDLYLGLHFPASDIPPQARDLYRINRTRLLYDRDQPTARLVARDEAALAQPLDMTHCMLRAMSPIHLKYLKNMRVRSSFSVSVVAFGQLWGLIALHNYGPHGKRIAFPLRRLCRLLGDSFSQNIERLSLAARLKSRQDLLGITRPSGMGASGYFTSDPEELFHLFRADYGVVSVGKEVKLLGPVDSSQEVLGLTEYLRLKRFTTILSTSNISKTFTDMVLPFKQNTVAGLLLIPLSRAGTDFMCFMRKAQIKQVRWAGNPYKPTHHPDGNAEAEANAALEPRKSFKLWMQTVADESLEWGQDDLDAAETLCYTFGRFISIWRRQEQAIQLTQLTSRLLTQARHDVRTPLHQILGFLEMTLDAPLDAEAQEHIRKSYQASRSLLHTVNELLDLTRQSHDDDVAPGINGSSVHSDTFDVVALVAESVQLFDREARRRNMTLHTNLRADTTWVVSDRHRIRQLIINVLSNSFKNSASDTGIVEIELMQLQSPADAEANPLPSATAMYELSISDNGKGMPHALLESIFRSLEEVTTIEVEVSGLTRTHAEEAYDTAQDSSVALGLEGQKAESLAPENGGSNSLSTREALGSSFPSSVESEAQSQVGLGVGLAVVARTVKLLKGQLRVESIENQGTTFTFRFPFTLSRFPQRKASSGMGSAPPSVPLGAQPTLARLSHEHNSDAGLRPCSPSISFGPHWDFSAGSGEGANATAKGLDSEDKDTKQGLKPCEDANVPPDVKTPQPRKMDSNDGAKDDQSTKEPIRPTPQHASAAPTQPPQQRKLSVPKRPGFGVRRASAHRFRTANSSPTSLPSGAAGTKQKVKSTVVPLRVLVVDDNSVNRMILKKRLVMDGHKAVMEAVDGQEAVDIYANDPFIDVVLMDLQMPILDGQGATRAIRALEEKQRAQQLQDPPANQGQPPTHPPSAFGTEVSAVDMTPTPSRTDDGDHPVSSSATPEGGRSVRSARRVPILAVSATLGESMRPNLLQDGLDGCITKPVSFSRLRELLSCVVPVAGEIPGESSSSHLPAICGLASAKALPAPWTAEFEFQPGRMDRGGWFGPLVR